jgi:hypothetical protein
VSGAARRKGLVGEREVADIFEANGWTVRGLESSGDWLAFKGGPLPERPALHLEVKRQERWRLPEWLAQARAEAPAGIAPVVVFRQNRGEWYACMPLADLLPLIG